MADKFDSYREALVVETVTVWPAELRSLDTTRKQQIEDALHADPKPCEQLEYIRVHTGFCRRITVTPGDVKRLEDQTS